MRFVTWKNEHRLSIRCRHLRDLLEPTVLCQADLDALVVEADEEIVDESL